jgi:hypothetical protein
LHCLILHRPLRFLRLASSRRHLNSGSYPCTMLLPILLFVILIAPGADPAARAFLAALVDPTVVYSCTQPICFMMPGSFLCTTCLANPALRFLLLLSSSSAQPLPLLFGGVKQPVHRRTCGSRNRKSPQGSTGASPPAGQSCYRNMDDVECGWHKLVSPPTLAQEWVLESLART